MVARRRRQGFVEQMLYVLVLIVVWVLLWDELSGMILISGAVLAFAVMRAFYLPPIQLSGRLNVYYGAYFVLWFMVNVLIASLQVAWLTVRPRPVDAGSVIAVDLATRSDLLITLVTMVNGLIPGSLVIEIDRARAVVFVHGLNCADEEELEQVRAKTHRIETLLICAIGSSHDIEALNDERAERGLRPLLEKRTIRERARRARAAKEARARG
ncbi:MAG TPA: Na+/H+ antiporter subunit E [Brevibacterium sp.]|nr:Na+/H+ antiporter subunit E [Brevibacterium sp.]